MDKNKITYIRVSIEVRNRLIKLRKDYPESYDITLRRLLKIGIKQRGTAKKDNT